MIPPADSRESCPRGKALIVCLSTCTTLARPSYVTYFLSFRFVPYEQERARARATLPCDKRKYNNNFMAFARCLHLALSSRRSSGVLSFKGKTSTRLCQRVFTRECISSRACRRVCVRVYVCAIPLLSQNSTQHVATARST